MYACVRVCICVRVCVSARELGEAVAAKVEQATLSHARLSQIERADRETRRLLEESTRLLEARAPGPQPITNQTQTEPDTN